MTKVKNNFGMERGSFSSFKEKGREKLPVLLIKVKTLGIRKMNNRKNTRRTDQIKIYSKPIFLNRLLKLNLFRVFSTIFWKKGFADERRGTTISISKIVIRIPKTISCALNILGFFESCFNSR